MIFAHQSFYIGSKLSHGQCVMSLNKILYLSCSSLLNNINVNQLLLGANFDGLQGSHRVWKTGKSQEIQKLSGKYCMEKVWKSKNSLESMKKVRKSKNFLESMKKVWKSKNFLEKMEKVWKSKNFLESMGKVWKSKIFLENMKKVWKSKNFLENLEIII